ncbi:helix-turn-helix transcriptional regulator [Roseateles oligotrophus]|uniref:Helix-turn-helix transcriptional regulator n=1 Tax=Roseateles oligotrophus TaxID=1769250 RepID=A0ABT2YKA4_9BURK|nr:helix-turn-helix transcriptional regulator [Roseateles oligotrophus]MCV2370487.1 helix-turn-helix transcriptional regulator [Roseateles oligotrophus]
MQQAFSDATAQTISTAVPHLVRTATVRDDLVGWVMSGRKRLVAPAGEVQFTAGQVFVIPRLTQWDMINEPKAGGRYEARLIGFTPNLIERFHQRFGQFSATPSVQGCASSVADENFSATFSHALAALKDGESSNTMREHRALEVLLLLAERGLVFTATRELAWADRVRRLVAQRPQANWSLSDVAQAFHLGASTLQRRLAEESASVSQCIREVRLETAMALLQDSGLQVSEVAARCGYDSHSRFSAAFRERFGYTPSHLRP